MKAMKQNTRTQVFDNTAVARDGTLEAGDEIVGVGGESVKGRSKVEVAKMIQVGIISIFPDLSVYVQNMWSQ